LSPAKTSLAEKLLAFVIAAVYSAVVAYIVVGVTRRAAVEVRTLRAERSRQKPAAPQLAAMMRRLLK
jgi:type II secretory pathway component PulK